MKEVCSFTTGSRRGYVRVGERNLYPLLKVPESLDGLRGNGRKVCRAMMDSGATMYTWYHVQGVPGKGYSTQYYYTVYVGYAEV